MFRAPVGKELNLSLFCGYNPIMMESLNLLLFLCMLLAIFIILKKCKKNKQVIIDLDVKKFNTTNLTYGDKNK